MSLLTFINESNRIEGIKVPAKAHEVKALTHLLDSATLTQAVIVSYVTAINPGSKLKPNTQIATTVAGEPAALHNAFTSLAPFTKDNGRAARAIWLWGMKKQKKLDRALADGFLKTFYQQTAGKP